MTTKSVSLTKSLDKSSNKYDDHYIIQYTNDDCLKIETVHIFCDGVGIFAPCDVLKERGEIVAAVSAVVNQTNPGDLIIKLGKKFNGKRIKDIPKGELLDYLNWFEEQGDIFKKPCEEIRTACKAYWKA